MLSSRLSQVRCRDTSHIFLRTVHEFRSLAGIFFRGCHVLPLFALYRVLCLAHHVECCFVPRLQDVCCVRGIRGFYGQKFFSNLYVVCGYCLNENRCGGLESRRCCHLSALFRWLLPAGASYHQNKKADSPKRIGLIPLGAEPSLALSYQQGTAIS